jgi:hypothetical protein
MKGLLLSLLVLAGYALTTAVVAHLTRPRTYLRLFVMHAGLWTPGYFLLYWLTPADLGFLPPAWQCAHPWWDALYGFAVFLLNCHTYVDCFFGFCTGFSVSMMLAIGRRGGLRQDEILQQFSLPDGSDRIYAWRLPYLQKIGWLRQDPVTGHYQLTRRGRSIARITWTLKRAMNLGKGG